MTGCNWKPGDAIKIKGTNKKGHVAEIIEDINHVQWDKLTPFFVIVVINGTQLVAHPSQLKRTK